MPSSCKRVLTTDTKETCEVKLLKDGQPLCVLIEGNAARDRQGQGKLCRAVVIDLSQQNRADELAATNQAQQSEIATQQKRADELAATNQAQQSEIAASKQAEQERENLLTAIEAEQCRLTDIFMRSPAFMVVLRGPEHLVERVNEEYFRLVGRRDILAKPLRTALPEIEGQGYLEILDSVYQTGEPFAGQGMGVRLRRTGAGPLEERCVDFLIQPMREDGGSIYGIFVHGVDVTERKQAEEELEAAKNTAERAKDAAEQANRTKDHFLAVLSHELRTPLTPVVMGLSMLHDTADLEPAIGETLEMVRRHVELEVRLIDDLLDVSRIARGKIELARSPVELCTVIHRAVEVCKPDIEARRLHFGVDLGAGASYWVKADVPRLQQVFWNLLKNAIKFTPHGGCVGIRCQPSKTDVLVEVNDSGMGIEPEALPRVFNPFEQVEQSITRQFGGLGLGLAISKSLVEMHDGTISAHSEGRDKGATFRVRLPLSEPAGQPEAPTPTTPEKRVVRPLRILLVEDHGVTAKMMRMVLTSEGHEIQTAGDVATGLELAGQERFDLLISDLGLPDATGYDLLRGIRERGQQFPAIVMSGYGQEADIQRSHEAGFAAHLTKPASREALIEAIAAVVPSPGPR